MDIYDKYDNKRIEYFVLYSNLLSNDCKNQECKESKLQSNLLMWSPLLRDHLS